MPSIIKYPKGYENDPIMSAVSGGDTIFWRVTDEALKEAFSEPDTNLFVRYEITKEGFNGIDLSHMYGSGIVDDVLYICDTDGQDLMVNGEEVDPENALEECDIEDLAPWIKDADADIIRKRITSYEILFEAYDVTDIATDLLNDAYSFYTVVKAANDIDLLDGVLF